GSVGDFELSISCATPPNDLCANAEPIECGDVVLGNNYNSTVSVDENCAEINAGNGVWYSFVGTGQDVVVTTCSVNTNFDTEIVVTTGDCSSQTCLTANDDDCGLQSTVTFYGEPGVTYNIYVSNYDDEFASVPFGEFELSVSCACPTTDAGTLSADVSPVCFASGSATVSASEVNAPIVPSGYDVIYVLTDGDSPNLDILDAGVAPSFTVSAGGNYIIHTLVYNSLDAATLLAQTTGVGVLGLLEQGGGTLCGSLDVAGAPVTVNAPSAGTITADANPNCLENGSATISATPDGNQVVPTGFVTLYALTDADNNLQILQTSATPSFTVTAAGNYVIHTFVYDPNELDPSLLPPGTTGGDVAVLLVENGGTVCASLDVAGAAISVAASCGPANDECAGAEVLVQGATCSPTAGTLAGATESQAPCSGGSVANDVWFSFEATAESAVIDVNGSADVDAVFEVFEGVCGALTSGGCVDQGFSAGDPESAQIDGLTIGNTYYVRVYHWTSTGDEPTDPTFDICVYDVPAPPANNVACGAVALNLGANGPFDHSNYSATGWEATFTAPAAASCSDQGGWCSFEVEIQNSAYYTFVAPASGNVSVSSDGSSFDTQIAVLSGSCQDVEGGSGVIVGANDDDPDASGSGGSSFTSNVLLCGLTAGETYYVLVDGYTGAEGDLVLTITEIGPSADFTSSATNLDVDFTDASTGAVSWDWDFGDGNSSIDQNPSHSYSAENTYTVCLTVEDADGCSSTYCEDVTVTDIPTSIAEAVENGMEVFPNPSNGEFVVAIRGVEADVQIIVMDLTGRQVYNEGVSLSRDFRKDVSLGNVAKGTYMLQISTTEGVVNRKIQVH
ncbi:MAG: PKD domain-containing protein, partial [Bacteroidetes bacterium]